MIQLVSDISNDLISYYNKKDYKNIFVEIDNYIREKNDTLKTDEVYRLQQDIAFLNRNLLTEISKYINTNEPNLNNSGEEHNKLKQTTFKEQSESTKINLYYKYFYLFI